jgi:Rieske Fe-S protein
VRWDAPAKKFRCPCHGGVYGPDGAVVEGPPPRPLDTIEARIDPKNQTVLVRI